jgi:magnesium chelatase family protein
MSTALIHSVAFWGLDAELVEVEADVKKGDRSHLVIVGLPDTAVKESKERVLSALKNSGYSPDLVQGTINLAPADIKKEGAIYDLPIALALLLAQGQISSTIQDFLCVGELSLTGQMRPMRGAISATLLARKLGKKAILLPCYHVEEVAGVSGIQIIGIENLSQAVLFLQNPTAYKSATLPPQEKKIIRSAVDFSEIKGQNSAKRALEVAAAGGHNLLLFGPPGTGKTLLAKALTGILPPLSLEEALEITKIHSLAGLLPAGNSLMHERPFRAPHHTISAIGLIGGGKLPRPGELSLAHLGVLFLDELPEFSRHTLEGLRQPLENGSVSITRSNTTLAFPTECIFMAAMNPCPCGYLGHPQKPCSDTHSQILRYRSKISGPLLDRIDLHIEVPHIPFEELSSEKNPETSEEVRARVLRARALQDKRFATKKTNAKLSPQEMKHFCALESSCQNLLKHAVDKMGISARGYSKILKIARTLADLEEKIAISEEHLMEALSFRSWDTPK